MSDRVPIRKVHSGVPGLDDYLRPLDLSIDETLLELQSAVKRLGAKRAVIDSRSGLELALAPTFRAECRSLSTGPRVKRVRGASDWNAGVERGEGKAMKDHPPSR